MGRSTISVAMRDGKKLQKKIAKLDNGAQKAVQQTVKEFGARAPAWITKGIREHYSTNTAAISEAGPKRKKRNSQSSVSGILVDGVSLEYKGRPLTLMHFNMKPKSQPAKLQSKQIKVPGQAIATAKGSPVAMVRPPKKYAVTATIVKDSSVSMGQRTFLATGRGGNALPFQRTGEERKPIDTIRTLSVPQMIDGRAKETIEDLIAVNLEKRFNHYVARAMK